MKSSTNTLVTNLTDLTADLTGNRINRDPASTLEDLAGTLSADEILSKATAKGALDKARLQLETVKPAMLISPEDLMDGLGGDGTTDSNYKLNDNGTLGVVPNFSGSGGEGGGRAGSATTTSTNNMDSKLSPEMANALGVETYGEAVRAVGEKALTGIATVSNPLAGLAVGGLFSALSDDNSVSASEALNIGEDLGLAVTGLYGFTSMAETAAEALGVYSTEDGIINSMVDMATVGFTDDEGYSPTTLAGFSLAGGIEGAVARADLGYSWTQNDLNHMGYDSAMGRKTAFQPTGIAELDGIARAVENQTHPSQSVEMGALAEAVNNASENNSSGSHNGGGWGGRGNDGGVGDTGSTMGGGGAPGGGSYA